MTPPAVPATDAFLDRVDIVLHRPQSPDNVGAVARVMMNFGLRHMRVVSPKRWEPARAKTLAAGNALLVVNRGPGDSSRFLIDNDITNVGRHPESDIFLDDITVSRHHAKFVRSAGKLYLEDLGSLNGTYVNRTLLDGQIAQPVGAHARIGGQAVRIEFRG